MPLTITSPVFRNGESIPSKYTCDLPTQAGGNINPPLEISEVPEGTKSLVLIMDDPDIPDFVKKDRGIEIFDHWVVFNIPPDTKKIEEGKSPEGVAGANSKGESKYTGPCPPDREHRYFFKLYALNTKINLPEGISRQDVEMEIAGNIIGQAELMGRYERKKLL